MKTTTIQKWGNSLAVRIPKAAADTLGLKEGQAMKIALTADGRSISLAPSVPGTKSLKEMLAQIKPENIHPVTDWGPPVGKEVW